MINFEQIIPPAAEVAGPAAIVAAPYPLPEFVCQKLAAAGVIGGFVADRRPDAECRDSVIGGWWTDRSSGTWFIRSAGPRNIILLGATAVEQISGQMLLEARLKGIRRIICVDADGTIVTRIEVAAAISERLRSVPLSNPVHTLNYDGMFEEIYDLLQDRVRLPHGAFAQNRILLISGSLQAGGAERQAVYTAAELSRRFPGQVYVGRSHFGETVDFFRPTLEQAGVRLLSTSDWADDYQSSDIVELRDRVVRRYGSLGAFSIFERIFLHALLIQRVRPGLVHVWQEYSNIPGGIAADLVGVPRLVLSGRSVAPDHFAIFQPYMAPGYHALLKRRDVVFLNNSEAGARDYARWLGRPREAFRVVHNGFEFPSVQSDVRIAKRRELGIPDDALVVGSIIRFSEEKRPDLLLEVARRICAGRKDVRFVVFGEGPLLQQCRARVDTETLSERVLLPGLAPDAWAALAVMDVFVLASRMEGLPNVMIEAQAMGLPVVCTGVGGMNETFIEGQTGFAVRSATAEDLVKSIEQLIDNPGLRNQMGNDARRHAREAFGIEQMIGRTLEAYRSAKIPAGGQEPQPDWMQVDPDGVIHIGGALKDEGACFVANLPLMDNADLFQLWEDDHALTLQSGPEAVRTPGHGGYWIEGDRIYFSSSDETDVRFNGKSYRLRPRDTEAEFDEIVIRAADIVPELGQCYIANLSLPAGSERFSLWENETRLGPGNALHAEIRQQGCGTYSVWQESIYFSASDNSDPRTNGRSYLLRRSKAAGRALANDSSEPADRSVGRAMRRLVKNVAPRDDFVPGRIVHVGGSLGPGGAERQMLYTLAGLKRTPVESVQLLCYYVGEVDGRNFFLGDFEAAGIPVRTFRRRVGLDDPASIPPSLRTVAQVLPHHVVMDIADLYWEFVQLRPEVVHAWLDVTNERAGLAAALAGVPKIVMSGRNVNPKHFAFYEPYMDAAYKALLELPQVSMLNNSRAGRDDYADWLEIDRDRIRVIYNGVNFPNWSRPSPMERAAWRQELGLSADAFVVGGAFRFCPEKRPLLWVEAAAEVAKSLTNAQFVLFGQGDMRADMEKEVDGSGLAGRFVFAGVAADILKAMAIMDVFLLTSEFEGLPNVVLEAQWANTPVVVTRAGGAPEALEPAVTGWIVDPATPRSIAARVEWLHDHPDERIAAGDRGQDFVRRKFSVDAMVEETVGLYKMRDLPVFDGLAGTGPQPD